MEIVFDKQFKNALNLLKNLKKNIFITGKAGSGKSTLLNYFMQKTEKNIAVLAPTGVSALNVKGETIHSFFRFKPGITKKEAEKLAIKTKKKNLYKNLHTIIIDEISMVRADLLDCVDLFLKKVLKKSSPFGGIRMVFIGDLYQLPPVLTTEEKKHFKNLYESPYFFSSNVMKSEKFKFEFLELDKIYRQNDPLFIEILNSIRNNTIDNEKIEILNERTNEKHLKCDKGYIYLTSTNKEAKEINNKKLLEINKKLFTFEAEILGEFTPKTAPTDISLQLKENSQVMFLINHPKGLFVNGSVGKITKILGDEISVKLPNGKIVLVERYNWQLYKYSFDDKSKSLIQEEIGSFLQFPLKLSWGITIHKSQGKTFDKVILDLKRGTFAHGQTYVGLSRCRTLKNLFLKYPIKKRHVLLDYKVVNFLTKLQYNLSEKKCSLEDKIAIIEKAIKDSKEINIVYLKANDQKSKRTIKPFFVGDMFYGNKKFLGIEAFCKKRNEERVFRVDRILEIL
jgi:ATP-dependent exoDNAse (exonuclease V) alpha subunit